MGPLGTIGRYLLECKTRHGLNYDSPMRDVKDKRHTSKERLPGSLYSLGCWWHRIHIGSPQAKSEAWKRTGCFGIVLDSTKESPAEMWKDLSSKKVGDLLLPRCCRSSH